MDGEPSEALRRRLDRLERMGRRWRALALATIGVAAVSLAIGPARPAVRAAAQEPPAPADAAGERDEATRVARARLEIIAATINRGAGIENAVDDIYDWSYRMLGDQIYLSMSSDEPRVEDAEVFLAIVPARPSPARRAAFEDHHRRMLQWENRLRPLMENGTLSRLSFLKVQSQRLQAELLLLRERIKEAPAAADGKAEVDPGR